MSKTLLEVCNITTGKLDSNAATENGKYPFFTCAPEPLRIDNYAFDDNVILLAGNNAQGNFHLTRYNGKFNAYQRTYIITARKNFDIDYIRYSIELYLNHFKKVSQGSQTKFLTMSILEQFKVENIPIEIQRNRTSILVAIDNKIALNKKINATLEAMAKTLYDYWFVQFDFPDENGKPYKSSGGKMIYSPKLGRDIPVGWEIKYVADLTVVKTGKEDANFATVNGKFAYFTCGKDIVRCDVPAFEGHAVLLAGNGDFNVKHYTGKFNAYQRTYVLIPDDEKYYALLYIAIKNAINQLIKNSVGSIVKFITIGDVNSITLLAPKNDSLLKMLNILIYKIEQLQSENCRLAELRDWLLPMLMNGQIKF